MPANGRRDLIRRLKVKQSIWPDHKVALLSWAAWILRSKALQPLETMHLFTNPQAVTFQMTESSATSLLKPQSCKPLVACIAFSY